MQCRTSSRGEQSRLVQALLETGEEFADFIGLTEVGDRVGKGVVVFDPEQRGEFGLVEFLDSDGDVVGQDEVVDREVILAVKQPGAAADDLPFLGTLPCLRMSSGLMRTIASSGNAENAL